MYALSMIKPSHKGSRLVSHYPQSCRLQISHTEQIKVDDVLICTGYSITILTCLNAILVVFTFFTLPGWIVFISLKWKAKKNKILLSGIE